MATDWMARLRISGTYKVVTALIPIIIAATVVICVFILKNDSEALQTSIDGGDGVLVQQKQIQLLPSLVAFVDWYNTSHCSHHISSC